MQGPQNSPNLNQIIPDFKLTFEEEEEETASPFFSRACTRKTGFDEGEVRTLVKGVSRLKDSQSKEIETSYEQILTNSFENLPSQVEEKVFAVLSDSLMNRFIKQVRVSFKDLQEERKQVSSKFEDFWQLCARVTSDVEDEGYKHSKGTCSKNKILNRLRGAHFTPYDYNCVSGENGDRYLNASCLFCESGKHIAAQGPTAETVKDFIQMILESKANTIVTLTEGREMGYEKCYPYWETKIDNDVLTFELKENDEQVINPIENQTISIRKFLLSKKGEEPRMVTQFHYRNWPDQGAPNLLVIEKLMNLTLNHVVEGPLVTHCSKGFGRTGTFIALYDLLKTLGTKLDEGVPLEDIEINIYETILKLRIQRQGLVQTKEQMEAIFDVLENFYKKSRT